MLSELLLLSGNDIPFPQGGFTFHQPTLGEIAYIGEEKFFIGLELLKFSKEILQSEDKIRLSSYSDFYIFMQILLDKSTKNNNTDCAFMVLDLLFPKYKLSFTQERISFHLDNVERDGYLCEDNFAAFKEILKEMFCSNKTSQSEMQYNPKGKLAEKIAEKLRNRTKKLAAQKSQSSKKKVAIFSRYISILAVGEQKDINSFMNYTVYQLFDEFERYELKTRYDVFLQARMAGASGKDLEQPVDWMSDIHDPEFECLVIKK